jgi:hypothetical protein
MPPVLSISEELPFDTPSQELSEGFKSIANTLDRIMASLADFPDTVVLITHDVAPGRELMILVSEEGLSVHQAGKAFAEAAASLEEAAELVQLQASAGLATASSDPLADTARHAWTSLPDAVRKVISAAKVVLLVPDYRSKASLVPWELLHDDKDYLLNSKVLARFGSLRHLVRLLDTYAPRAVVRRALVVSAAGAIPERPLPTAAPECAQIRDGLRAEGFDAPDIAESRLDAAFFTDRLSWVDALHVAGHGESRAGTEYLALPGNRRLSVDHLLARHQRSMPFVYLNTCQLGLTRWLGGGQSRGLAFTLAELGAPAVLSNTSDVLDDVATDVATAFYEEALTQPVGFALLAARRRVTTMAHPALVARVILYGDPRQSISGAMDETPKDDVASRFLDAYFDGRDEHARVKALRDPALQLALFSGGMRARAARHLVQGFAKLQPGEKDLDAQFVEIGYAIALADELHHPAAMAMMRMVRASLAMHRGDGERERGWMRDAIAHLSALPSGNTTWDNALSHLRGELRKRVLRDSGLEVRSHGPADTSGVLDAAMAIKLATEQAQEEELSAVVPREDEETLDDILWNAVVAGHPNRFEDTIEASAYCRIVTLKLVARGFVQPPVFDVAHAMLTGLLWWLWSSQTTSYLSHEMAEGQMGTLRAMLRDLAMGTPVDGREAWRKGVSSFAREVEAVLSALDQVPWEKSHIEIPKQMSALREKADALLTRVSRKAPGALAGVTAYVTGLLAVKNVFTPLECQDDMHEHMTAAINGLSRNNEGRFMPYLMQGFEPIRTREPDELARWRLAPRKYGS